MVWNPSKIYQKCLTTGLILLVVCWRTLDPGLPVMCCNDLALSPSDNYARQYMLRYFFLLNGSVAVVSWSPNDCSILNIMNGHRVQRCGFIHTHAHTVIKKVVPFSINIETEFKTTSTTKEYKIYGINNLIY